MAITINSVDRYGFKRGANGLDVTQLIITNADKNQDPIYTGNALQIQASVASPSGVKSIKVWYKNSGELTYTKSTPMMLNNQAPYYIDWKNSNYNAIIPNNDIVLGGLSYYLEVTDNADITQVSVTHAVGTMSPPNGVKTPFWGHESMGWTQGAVLKVDDNTLALSLLDVSNVICITNDLITWNFDGRYKYPSIYDEPIDTPQGRKWLYVRAFLDSQSQADSTYEYRMFYHLDDAPYLTDYSLIYDTDAGRAFWIPVQNSYNLTSPTGISGDFFGQFYFYMMKPVIKNDYLYISTYIYDSYEHTPRYAGETKDAWSVIRILRIRISDLFLGKQFETYKTFTNTFFIEKATSESILIDDGNKLWLFVRGDASKATSVTCMDWITEIWTTPYTLCEGLSPKGFVDNDGTIYIMEHQRDYSNQIPTGSINVWTGLIQENSNKAYLYRHLSSKPWNEWEPREFIADGVTIPSDMAYHDINRFKGNMVVSLSGQSYYKVLDEYYKAPISISTLTLTLTGNTLTATSTVTGLNTGEVPIIQYRRADGQWLNLPTATLISGDLSSGVWQSTTNADFLPDVITCRAEVIRAGQPEPYYSAESAPFTVRSAIVTQTPIALSDTASFGLVSFGDVGFGQVDSYPTGYVFPPISDTDHLILFDKNDQMVAILDNAIDVAITEAENAEETLEFTLPITDPKWTYIKEDRKVWIAGREFIINGLGDKRDEQGALLSNVQCIINAHYELDKVLNQVLALDTVIAKDGLETILDGTGWTVGQVDSTKYRSLANDMQSVLYNLREWNKLHGGYLIFNSKSRTVDMLDNPGDDLGVQIRVGKNLISVERNLEMKEFVTRLYPMGDQDLTVNAVHPKSLSYLDNFSYYTDQGYMIDEIYADIGLKGKASKFLHEAPWKAADYVDAQALYDDGLKYLMDNCKPKVGYVAKVVDLSTQTGYSHEKFGLHDTLTLIDEDIVINTKQRIVKRKFYPLEDGTRDEAELANRSLSMINSAVQTAVAVNQVASYSDVWNSSSGAVANSKNIWDRANIINPDGTINTDYLRGIWNALNAQIVAGNNENVTIGPDGIIVADHRVVKSNGLAGGFGEIGFGSQGFGESTGTYKLTWDTNRYMQLSDGELVLIPGDGSSTSAITPDGISGLALVNESLISLKLAPAAITTEKIANLAVDITKLANLSVGAAQLIDSSITTDKIQNLAVAAGKLADASVGTIKMTDLAVDATKLAGSSVIAEKIANAAVGNAAIANAAVGSAAIANLAVGSAAIAALAVGTAHIADGAILSAKIGIAQILSANIGNAAINTAQIGDLAVTSLKIAGVAITSDKIASSAITGDKIAVSAITGDKIAANTITANQIDATNLHVAAANITGTLTANQITTNIAQVYNDLQIGGQDSTAKHIYLYTGTSAADYAVITVGDGPTLTLSAAQIRLAAGSVTDGSGNPITSVAKFG